MAFSLLIVNFSFVLVSNVNVSPEIDIFKGFELRYNSVLTSTTSLSEIPFKLNTLPVNFE